MATMLELFSLFFPEGGCGFQHALGICTKNLPDDEETHRCILDFQSMRQMYTHEEVEQVMHQLGWKTLAKQGGWRRYFKGADANSPHGVATIAKLPARSFVDAPKHIILDFVKSVNRRENRNVLCCWWGAQGAVTLIWVGTASSAITFYDVAQRQLKDTLKDIVEVGTP